MPRLVGESPVRADTTANWPSLVLLLFASEGGSMPRPIAPSHARVARRSPGIASRWAPSDLRGHRGGTPGPFVVSGAAARSGDSSRVRPRGLRRGS